MEVPEKQEKDGSQDEELDLDLDIEEPPHAFIHIGAREQITHEEHVMPPVGLTLSSISGDSLIPEGA